MKTIGLIGGLSWESTATYYRRLNELTRDHLGGHHSAKILLHSLDFAEIEQLQVSGGWSVSGDELTRVALGLEHAGADVVLICSNTMHKVVDQVIEAISVPLLHIGEVTGEAIRQRGLTCVGLLGTRYTMEEDFYRFAIESKSAATVQIPDAHEREVVHRVIYEELCQGVIRGDSRATYLQIIAKMIEKGAQGIILGCTEIGLLTDQAEVSVPVFDTTELHVAAAIQFSLSA